MQYKEGDELEGIVTITSRCLRKKNGWINYVEIDTEGDKELCDIVLHEIEAKSKACSLAWFQSEIEEALDKKFPEEDE